MTTEKLEGVTLASISSNQLYNGKRFMSKFGKKVYSTGLSKNVHSPWFTKGFQA